MGMTTGSEGRENKGRRVVYDGYYKIEVVTILGRKRETICKGNTVTILLYDRKNRKAALVRQPREAMITDENPGGLITEPVAGMMEPNVSVKALAVKEAWEEARVLITEDDVEVLNQGRPMATSPGTLTEFGYLCYAEFNPDLMEQGDRESSAEGEDERCRRVLLSEDELRSYVCEDMRAFALIQYLLRKLKSERVNEWLGQFLSRCEKMVADESQKLPAAVQLWRIEEAHDVYLAEREREKGGE